MGSRQHLLQFKVAKHGYDEENGIGASCTGFIDLDGVYQKVLSQNWNTDRLAYCTELGHASTEVRTVGKHRDGFGASPFIVLR
jgi:hypothetical protein